MKAFIYGLRLIRVESDEYIYDISLPNLVVTWFKNDGGNQFFKTNQDIEIHALGTIQINQSIVPLHIGLVTLSDEFDKKYRYDGPLGVIYTKAYTEFYLFTPVAREVHLVVDGKTYPTTYENGVRYAKVLGDLEKKTYYYQVKLEDVWYDVKDPYANAQGLNGNHIIDWSKTIQSKPSPIKLKKYVDAVIYEGHVRDMTVSLDVAHKGTFNGLIEPSKHLGMRPIDYIKKLGMTQLQLLPIYDFELVDEVHKNNLYNWSYKVVIQSIPEIHMIALTL